MPPSDHRYRNGEAERMASMTTGEAEAYRLGWRDAAARAVAVHKAIAIAPVDPAHGDLAENGYRKGARWAADLYRDMLATSEPPPMPAPTRFGILGEG